MPADHVATPVGLASAGHYEALGFRFEISTADGALRTALEEVLCDMRSPHRPVHHYSITPTTEESWDIHLDGRGLRTAANRDQALRHVLWHVNSETLRTEHSHAILHAGAVAIEGRGVLLPGAINAGKTTLTAALSMDGAAAMSDEFGAIRIGTQVLDSYPRPFNLGVGSWTALSLDTSRGLTTSTRACEADLLHIAPSRLAGSGVRKSVTAAAIVFPAYAPDHSTELIRLDRVVAVEQLLHHCMNLHAPGAAARYATVVEIGLGLPAYRLTFSSLRAAVERARSVVETPMDGT